MKKKKNAQPENILSDLNGKKMLHNHFQLMWRTTGITILVIGFFGGIGYMIDKSIEKFPLFMTTGLIIGYPVTQFIIFKVFKKFAQKKYGRTTH